MKLKEQIKRKQRAQAKLGAVGKILTEAGYPVDVAISKDPIGKVERVKALLQREQLEET